MIVQNRMIRVQLAYSTITELTFLVLQSRMYMYISTCLIIKNNDTLLKHHVANSL